jgi:TnpA family transposase
MRRERLYLPNGKINNHALAPMIGVTINLKAIRRHWSEILRLATSIKQGTVTASLMLRKLGQLSSPEWPRRRPAGTGPNIERAVQASALKG